MREYSEEDFFELNPILFHDRLLRESEVIQFFTSLNAFWIHDGDYTRPHVELSDGNCSNGYFNCREALKYPRLCEIFALQLYKKINLQFGLQRKVNWVIGSSYSAITFSHEMAKLFNAKHGFTERDPYDRMGKKMVFKDTIKDGETVLQIEELIGSGQSFAKVRSAVKQSNPGARFFDVVGAIVYRPVSLKGTPKDTKIISLIEKEIQVFPKENCPLCKKGSAPILPRTHWADLVYGRPIT